MNDPQKADKREEVMARMRARMLERYRQAEANRPDYGVQDIERVLTANGVFPIDWCVAFGEAICQWQVDKSGEPGLFLSYLRDPVLKKLCMDHLQERGAVVSSLDELKEYGHRHRWPQLDELDADIEDWKARKLGQQKGVDEAE